MFVGAATEDFSLKTMFSMKRGTPFTFLRMARLIPSLQCPCSYHYTDLPIFVPHPNPQKVGKAKNFLAFSPEWAGNQEEFQFKEETL